MKSGEANLRLTPQKSENKKVFALLFCTFIAFSYLGTRVHAVLALRGSEGVGQTYWIQRLTTLCFWSPASRYLPQNLENSNIFFIFVRKKIKLLKNLLWTLRSF